MNDYTLLATEIIKHQELIVGPLAWRLAKSVSGIEISNDNTVEMHGNGTQILDSLVSQYENLFGMASVEACKDAIRPVLSKVPKVNLPQKLL